MGLLKLTLNKAIKSLLKSSFSDTEKLLLISKIPREILDSGVELESYKFVEDYVKKYKTFPSYERVESEFPDLAAVKYPIKLPVEDVIDSFVEERKKEYLVNLYDNAIQNIKDDKSISISELNKQAAKIQGFGKFNKLTSKSITTSALIPATGTFKLGIKAFDDEVGGLLPGETVCFVARPNVGKTTFLLWLSGYMWYNDKRKVLFITGENTSTNIMQRFVSLHSDVNPNIFRKWDLVSTTEKNQVESTLLLLNTDDEREFIVPEKRITSMDALNSLVHIEKPDCIVIDAFYKMNAGLKEDDATRNVASLINSITQLAVDTGIPVFITSQLNRMAKDGKGDLSNVAFSDTISMSCDYIFNLEEDPKEIEKRVLTLIKTRAGFKNLMIPFKLNFDNLRFEECT